MVAFYLPESGCSLEAEYLRPLGLGDCTLANGVLQADLPLSADDIVKIEDEGFTRADIHWYTISPEPTRDHHKDLMAAFGGFPSTTLPPVSGVDLKVSFVSAIQPDGLQAIGDLGYKIQKLDI